MLIYLTIINAITLICMLIDKQNAIHARRRIPEATLMLLTSIGGSVGTLLGMHLFRHKTLKPKFSIGVPVILALQLVAAVIFATLLK